MIQNESDICKFLNIPSIPKKEWDGKKSFKSAVAVTKLRGGDLAYAVASYDCDFDAKPRIKKVFAQEPFVDTLQYFVVPDYMDLDVDNMDLDDISKVAARAFVNEVKEQETTEEIEEIEIENEYFFDNIHSDEEAMAFIRSYNKRHNLRKGRIPTNHEKIIARLYVIYKEETKKK